jgi:hypothetical protein
VSPNGGLKAAPSPPQKQNREHTRQKEVNSTGWSGSILYVDVLIGLTLHSSSCSARYGLEKKYSEEIKKIAGKLKNGAFFSPAKTPHEGVIRGNKLVQEDPAASTRGPQKKSDGP